MPRQPINVHTPFGEELFLNARGLSMPHQCQGKKVNVDTLRIESLKNKPEFIGVHVSAKGILVPRPPNPIGPFRRVPCVIGLCFYRVLTLTTVPCDLCRRYTAPMTQEASELLKKALALSTEERAQLVDSLLESLEERHEDPPAVEAAWNDEVARRIAELDSGNAKTIPWEEIRQRISAKLTNGR